MSQNKRELLLLSTCLPPLQGLTDEVLMPKWQGVRKVFARCWQGVRILKVAV